MHYALQARWRAGADLGKRWWILIEDGRHRFGRRGLTEGLLAGDHLVKDGAEGEDVGAVVRGISANLLGGHVAGSAEHHAGLSFLCDSSFLAGSISGWDQASETKVENFYTPIFGEE